MPFNKRWRDLIENETEFDEEELAEVEKEMLRLHGELEVYQTQGWGKVEAMLDEEFIRASEVMMATNDMEELKLARDRARFVSQLKRKPKDLEQRLDDLRQRRRELKGEAEGE
jgi:hypothetical protein